MPPFGARMPFVGSPLDDATIACVLAWASEQGDAGFDAGSCNGAPPPPSGDGGRSDAGDGGGSDGGNDAASD
jgi:hypothetical protein